MINDASIQNASVNFLKHHRGFQIRLIYILFVSFRKSDTDDNGNVAFVYASNTTEQRSLSINMQSFYFHSSVYPNEQNFLTFVGQFSFY